MVLTEQIAEAKVVDVLWSASKDGYLKPRVRIEPVKLGGVTIEYATGFNAQFIHEKGIGPGAFIEIIRSGDVIPYIKEVKSAATGGPQMPKEKWHWNETHVDAVLNDVDSNHDVKKRALLYFAQTLEIGNCGEGTIVRLYDAGIHTIEELLSVKKEFILEHVAGFKTASATKLVEQIKEAVAKATITQYAVGSGIFGRGIGTKRTEAALQIIPKNFKATKDLVDKIAELPSWSKESAEGFVAHLEEFKQFLDRIGVKAKVPERAPSPKKNGSMVGQVVLFTGFHPKELEEKVVKEGGVVADTFSKKVTVVVIKDESVSNEKTKKALASNIPVLTADSFAKKL
jgi:DNA ligase (NAD+)